MVAFARAAAAVVGGWLLAGAAAAIAHERFVAVETGAVLSPRMYRMSPAQPLGKRQDGCDSGSHPCNEIGPAGAKICCPNTQYCIIDPSNPSQAGCCHIGSTCSSPCAETAYQCNITSTITTSSTTTTTLIPACCPRVCTSTSMFQCATSLGGGCCVYGASCAAGGQCLSTAAPSTSNTITLAPPGCETGQVSCASTLGGGCCDAKQTCTLITGKAHCAENGIVPTGSGVTVVDADEAGGGLGAGAKAGLGVGVVFAAGVVIGGVTWWCLRRRKRSRAGSETTGGRVHGVTGRVLGGGAGLVSPMSEEATSDGVSRSGRFGAQDYFGSGPALGPYSDTPSAPSGVTTPGVERGGVPLQPNEPGDIAVPVEIDSRLTREERGVPSDPVVTPEAGVNRPRYQEQDDGQERFELYGSEVGSPGLPPPDARELPSPTPEERPGQH